MKVWIGVTMLLCLMAAPRAEAAPIYTTTDLGVSFQLQADGGGQVHDVAGANGAVYAFDKSPVTQIYERTDEPWIQQGNYYVYTLQNGNYKVGYEYGSNSVVGNSFRPSFPTSSAWFTWASYPTSTSPEPSPVSDINSQGQVVGTSLLANGIDGYHPVAAFSGLNLQLHGPYGLASDNLNDYIAPTPGVTLTSAVKIDDLGQIIAVGTNGDDFLLTPVALGPASTVPEPSTAALLGMVGSLLGLRAVRRPWWR